MATLQGSWGLNAPLSNGHEMQVTEADVFFASLLCRFSSGRHDMA